MTHEEVSDMLFKEFTAVLAKHNVNPEDAEFLTAAFGPNGIFFLSNHLNP